MAKPCDYDCDSDAVYLARAARIIKKNMFKQCQLFNGSFTDKCQEEYVPQLLLTLVSMILEGAGVSDIIICGSGNSSTSEIQCCEA